MYKRQLFSSVQGSVAISISMLTIIFAGVILLDNSILQSTNNYKKNIGVLVSIIVIKFLTNYQFTLYLGIVGAALSSVLSMAIGTFLSEMSLKKIGLSRKLSRRFVKKIVVCSVIMVSVVFCILRVTNSLETSRIGSFIQCIIGVPVGAVFYVGSTRYGNLFSDKEWKSIPGGEYVLKIFKKRMDK